MELLSRFFHMPINEASKVLGICSTSLKKICRKHGLVRWPHRKVINSLNIIILFILRMHIPKQVKSMKNKLATAAKDERPRRKARRCIRHQLTLSVG